MQTADYVLTARAVEATDPLRAPIPYELTPAGAAAADRLRAEHTTTDTKEPRR